MRKQHHVFWLLPLCLAILLLSCTGIGRTKTEYAKQQEVDAGKAYDEAKFRAAIGEEKFFILRQDLTDAELNQLIYGLGQSNAIDLVNGISDITRVTAILNGPDAIDPATLVQLINAVDAQISAGRKYQNLPDPNDTLRKIYQLMNGVNSVTSIKKAILGVVTNGNDPLGSTAVQRLALLVAMTNENKGIMPALLNTIVTPGGTLDAANLAKLLRVINETNDLRRLVQFINGIDDGIPAAPTGAGIINAANLIRELDNAGVPNTIELLNDTNVNIDYLAQIVNSLPLSGIALLNNDSFAGTPDWTTPSRTHNWASHASYGTSGYWYYTSGTGFLNFDMSTSQLARYSVLHTKLKINTSGNLAFTLGIGSLSAGSQIQIAVTGCVNEIRNFAAAGTYGVNIPLATGVCHVKIITEGPGGYVYIANFSAPGSQDADRTPAQKVAILLNKVNVAGNATLAKVLTSAVPGGEQAIDANDIPKLVALIERAHFPAASSSDPGVVTLINGITNVDTLRRIVHGLNNNGVRQLTEAVNFLGDLEKGIVFINQLHNANAGKVYDVINGLTPNATWSLLDTIDNLSVAQMAELKNLVHGVETVDHFSMILNTLSPVHYTVRPVHPTPIVAFSSTESGGKKLADLLTMIMAGPMTISNHMVRLSDDISKSAGAANLARIINALDPTISPVGTQRMYELVNSLQNQGSPKYNQAYDLTDGGTDHISGGDTASAADHFGRLTTLANTLASGGADVMAAMVNYTDHNSFPQLTQLVRDVRRIQYLSHMANSLQNIELLTNAIPAVDMNKMLEILNDIGNSTERGGIAGQKAVGDMWIFADAMNKLGVNPDGTPRALSNQLKITRVINEVTACGMDPATDIGPSVFPWVWNYSYFPEKTGICPSPKDTWRKRASNAMLGLKSGKTLATLVGDINNVDKALKLMNGIRDVDKLITLLNIVPDQVMLAHLNAISIGSNNAVERTLLYLLNRQTAQDVARLVHYGTGIGKGSMYTQCGLGDEGYWDQGWRYYNQPQNAVSCGGVSYKLTHYDKDRKATGSGCNYYRAVGPTRLAAILNAETGPRLQGILNKMGARTATAAIGCGLSVGQTMVGGYTSVFIPASESVTINRTVSPVVPSYTHTYQSSSFDACNTSYGGDNSTGQGTWATDNWYANRRGYYPNIMGQGIDPTFHPYGGIEGTNPASPLWVISDTLPSATIDRMVYGNITGVWDLMNCQGFLGLIACAGALPLPPNPLPADCDVDPFINATDGGSSNAVGDTWGPPPS